MVKYNIKEYLIYYYYPAILHYVMVKPYLKDDNKFHFFDWWEYAKKLDIMMKYISMLDLIE